MYLKERYSSRCLVHMQAQIAVEQRMWIATSTMQRFLVALCLLASLWPLASSDHINFIYDRIYVGGKLH